MTKHEFLIPDYTIDSQLEVLAGYVPGSKEEILKNEPMLFNCDLKAAQVHAGILTYEFLHRLPQEWKDAPLVIDSRVHMLMKGWYPCIPGWHHDDVPRTRNDGQPNYEDGQNRSEHIMLLINGDICPTEFAIGEHAFYRVPPPQIVYEKWHKDVERALRAADPQLKAITAPSNHLIKFNDRTWHRGTAAVQNGWRFFIRASRYYSPTGEVIERGNTRTNELRRQVQVYLENVNVGW